jgi:hypothetical protein
VQFAFQIAAYVAGLTLELAIMVVLLRGQWKRYPFVFVYLICDFLTTAMEIEPSLHYATASAAEKLAFSKLYWLNERIIQVSLFLLVISLVYRATAEMQPRRTLLLLVITGTALIVGVSLLIRYNPDIRPGKWMTPWTRDMNFFAAILDLGLWAALIGKRKKDYKLMMISGALGIQFTGGAIGQALRQMTLSPLMASLTAVFITLCNMSCLYIWWQAFRMPQAVAIRSAAPVSAQSEPQQ